MVRNIIRKVISYITSNHQRLANLSSLFNSFFAIPATILGVWFTVYSINQTEKTVETQLQAQKKATSMSIVGDYTNFLSDLIIAGVIKDGNVIADDEDAKKELENVIINRTQLLIDNLNFPELTYQIIQFLGNNNLGFLFDSRRSEIGGMFVRLDNIKLNHATLLNTIIDNPQIECSDFKQSIINKAKWNNSQIIYSDFSSSNITESDFSCSKETESSESSCSSIKWTNFKYAYITETSFKGANITYSDLRYIKFYNLADLTRIKEVNAIVGVLKEAKSLYGSLIDKDVKDRLMEQGYDNLFIVNSIISENIKDEKVINKEKEKNENQKNLIEQNGWLEEFKKQAEKRCELNFSETENK